MGTFRYYLPQQPLNSANRIDISAVQKAGLWDRLDDVVTGQLAHDRYICNPLHKGPDNGEGVLIVPEPPDGTPVAGSEFAPDRQTWGLSESGKYWIGIDREHPPTPEGLVRGRTVSGVVATLGDGRQWLCPTIRTELLTPRVPMTYAMSGGQLIGQVQQRYADVWRRSKAWCLRFLEDFKDERVVDLLGGPEAFRDAVACLAINYRIGIEEASALRILDDQALESVIDAAIDMHSFREIHLPGADPKKKHSWLPLLADWQSSLRGSADSTPATNPPEPTSN
jgi:hypothetical protein